MDEDCRAPGGAPTGPAMGPGGAEPELGAVGAADSGLEGWHGGRYWLRVQGGLHVPQALVIWTRPPWNSDSK